MCSTLYIQGEGGRICLNSQSPAMAKCPNEILDNMDHNVKFLWHNTVNHYISINILVHNVEKVGSSVPLRKLLCKFRQNVSLLQMHTDSWKGFITFPKLKGKSANYVDFFNPRDRKVLKKKRPCWIVKITKLLLFNGWLPLKRHKIKWRFSHLFCHNRMNCPFILWNCK